MYDLIQTRLARESDYSPSLVLFAEIVINCDKVLRNNPNLHFANIDVYKNLVKFCPFILDSLSRNQILISIKGCNSVTNL